MIRLALALVLVTLLLTACGDDPAPEIPSWAKVAPEQIAEAKKHGVPVAFENDLGMRFVLIPAGTFTMGSPEDEEGRDDNETQHEVTISKPFYMSIYEVTNEQYRRYAPDYHSPPFNWEIPSEEGKQYVLDGDKQPVVMVSWNEATAFAKWLNGPDRGRTYRLPTEAERERACRAGTTTRFSFGDRDEDLVRYANFEDVNDPIGLGREDLDDGHGVAAPVGSFRPNPWGLHDTHGNVFEWCLDVYGPYPSGRVTDPQGAEGDGSRVVRGGSWNDTPMYLRSAHRDHADADGRGILVGFRLVSPLPE